MIHNVFISYRRDGGENLAGRVKDALKNRGFSVFMDVEDLKSGLFDTALFSKIEEATDFIVVLTAGCLERCKNEDDWFRQEIRHAIKCKKNIIPIIARDFQMPLRPTLPADIQDITRYNGLTPAHELFDASMDRLVSAFLQSRHQFDENSSLTNQFAMGKKTATSTQSLKDRSDKAAAFLISWSIMLIASKDVNSALVKGELENHLEYFGFSPEYPSLELIKKDDQGQSIMIIMQTIGKRLMSISPQLAKFFEGGFNIVLFGAQGVCYGDVDHPVPGQIDHWVS